MKNALILITYGTLVNQTISYLHGSLSVQWHYLIYICISNTLHLITQINYNCHTSFCPANQGQHMQPVCNVYMYSLLNYIICMLT